MYSLIYFSSLTVFLINRDVEQLYEIITVGTKVTIYGHVLGEPSLEPRKLAEGDVGADVQLIQNRLKNAGYYSGV